MDFNLKIWRQKNAREKGHFETYHISGIEEDASFLEMLDILNEQLIREGNDPVAVERGCQSSGPVSFDHARAAVLSHSTMTAVKVSAEHAPSTLTDVHMDRTIM